MNVRQSTGIPVADVIAAFGNNESEVARFFRVNRASVNEWKSRPDGFLSDGRAFELAMRRPDLVRQMSEPAQHFLAACEAEQKAAAQGVGT